MDRNTISNYGWIVIVVIIIAAVIIVVPDYGNTMSNATYEGATGLMSQAELSTAEPGLHTITVETVDHGYIELNRTEAKDGNVIAITATPDEGYHYSGATLSFNNTGITLAANENTFAMYDYDIIITPKFETD